jgi:hypothetical protein
MGMETCKEKTTGIRHTYIEALTKTKDRALQLYRIQLLATNYS